MAVAVIDGEYVAGAERCGRDTVTAGVGEGGDDAAGGGVPQVRVAALARGGEDAIRPERHGLGILRVGEGSDDAAGGGVPQVGAAVIVRNGEVAVRSECHRQRVRPARSRGPLKRYAVRVGEGGYDAAGGGVPQVCVAVD